MSDWEEGPFGVLFSFAPYRAFSVRGFEKDLYGYINRLILKFSLVNSWWSDCYGWFNRFTHILRRVYTSPVFMTAVRSPKKRVATVTKEEVFSMAEKRTVVVDERKDGLAIQDLILIAVLIAAGAVLKLTVSSFLTFAGMKPNFMIAMYCIAIILTRPNLIQSACIGLLVGLVSQIPLLNATPLVNFASELVGAVVCCLLVTVFSRVASRNTLIQNMAFPAVITFVSTTFSGYTFAMIVGVTVSGLEPVAVFGVYAVMVLGTAAMNCVVAAILIPVLRKVLKK